LILRHGIDFSKLTNGSQSNRTTLRMASMFINRVSAPGALAR